MTVGDFYSYRDYLTKTEVHDLERPSTACTSWADAPQPLIMAAAGFFEDGLVICSGIKADRNITNKCFMITETYPPDFPFDLINASRSSAGVMIDRNTFFVTGGIGGK